MASGDGLAQTNRIESPNGRVAASVALDGSGRIVYAVDAGGRNVLAPAPVGLTVEGVDWGNAVSLKLLDQREAHERFPVRGVHAEGRYDARVALFSVTPRAGEPYGLQVCVADEGFAWRLLVPGAGARRVNAETACWRLPSESRVWFGERLSDWKLKSYAGEWTSAPLGELCRISPQGPVQTMPLVAELPDGAGYGLVTEAALFGYSGLRLEACSDGMLRGVFTEPDGFVVEGRVVTPWRVTILAPTLDALVNADLIAALSPPPDPALFGDGDMDWAMGGRSVWSWWQDDAGYLVVPEEQKVIDCAARLTFEFTTLDEGWESWTNTWETLKSVCDYGRERRVRVFVWKPSKEVCDPTDDYAALRGFLDRVRAAGAAGVKIDFINSEAYDRVVFEERVLREAARRRLLVNFHGCQKPSGESRTYPNEVTREAVRGLELNRIAEKGNAHPSADGGTPPVGSEGQPLAASHNAALPFTRGAVGAADYTPIGFSRPGRTTWAQQLAMAYGVTSPLLVMAEDPRRLLEDPRLAPAIPFLMALPTVWDETRVLEGSRIGELAVLARRAGKVWYVVMINGTSELKLVSFVPGFTGWPSIKLTCLRDVRGEQQAFASARGRVSGRGPQIVTLEPCGGYVAKLERAE